MRTEWKGRKKRARKMGDKEGGRERTGQRRNANMGQQKKKTEMEEEDCVVDEKKEKKRYLLQLERRI